MASLLLSLSLNRWVPTLDTAPQLDDLLGVLATFTVVGLAGSLAPRIRLGRTDPVGAFRP